MKILIVYFSRTGTTKKIAQELSEKLEADSEELIDPVNYAGPIGYLKAGRSAAKGDLAKIKELKYKPDNYDLIILGTPVWVGRMAPAVKTFVHKNKESFKQVIFFTTQGGAYRQRVFDDLKKLSGKEPVTELMLRTKDVQQDTYGQKIIEFINTIKKLQE